jgi:hypothetical protein
MYACLISWEEELGPILSDDPQPLLLDSEEKNVI